jgi:hypothetical protein
MPICKKPCIHFRKTWTISGESFDIETIALISVLPKITNPNVIIKNEKIQKPAITSAIKIISCTKG